MAKTEPAPQASQPTPLQLSVNDIIGAMQRQLQELNSYLWNDPRAVDPAVVVHYLERTYLFAQQLPVPEGVSRDAATDRKAS